MLFQDNKINQVGALAISTRMQRLADMIRKDGELIYKLYGVDFQPKWFPVFITLKHAKSLTVTELADHIGYAHPSTISLLKELEKNKLIVSKKDKNDERKRIIFLSKAGLDLLSQIEPVWDTMQKSLDDLINNQNNLLLAIEEMEDRLLQQSFFQKAMELKNQQSNTQK